MPAEEVPHEPGDLVAVRLQGEMAGLALLPGVSRADPDDDPALKTRSSLPAPAPIDQQAEAAEVGYFWALISTGGTSGCDDDTGLETVAGQSVACFSALDDSAGVVGGV